MNKLLVAAALSAAIFLTGCDDDKKDTIDPPRPIKAVVAHFTDIGQTLTQTGEIKPRVETNISFRLDGQLTFRVENGSPVRKGQLLASVDKTPASNGVLSAKADLATARSSLVLAETTALRNRDLFAKNVTSRAQLQEAEANLESAKARIEAANASLASAEDKLSYTDLLAQRNGIVSAVGANEGQVVQAGQTVVTLFSDDERDAVFDVPEKLFNMNLEAPLVEVGLISDPSVTAHGSVREVAPSADPVTRTFRVKVALDAAGADMPFGAAVVGSLILSPQKLASLPASALTEKDGQTAVLVLKPDTKKLFYKVVELGRFDDDNIYVAKGLSEGDIVAVAGVTKLREGELVAFGDEVSK